MDGLLGKISSYKIFNYLLPGSLFAVVADAVTAYRLHPGRHRCRAFSLLFHRAGGQSHRIPGRRARFWRAVRFVNFVDYRKFAEVSKADPKINVLSETNNMYRTLCALFLLLLLVVLFDRFAPSLPWLVYGSPYIAGVAFVIMFLFAYRKQTAYIVERVNRVVDREKAGTDGANAR